jgi:hypothetical protein
MEQYGSNISSVSSAFAEQQNICLHDSCHVLAAINPHVISMLRGSLGNHQVTMELEYFGRLHQSTQDALAAATAIGNETAVKHFLSIGSHLLEVLVGFSSPIKAASSSGRDGFLAILLGHVEQDITTTGGDFETSTGPATCFGCCLWPSTWRLST